MDRLTLYNSALRHLGERKLSSLSENRQPRRDLDEAWAAGAVDWALEGGQWKFAMRSVMLDASPSVTPEFGFSYAFDKPSDHLKLGGVFSDEAMQVPLRDYREEGGYWYANLETIFVRYVSNDSEFGGDLSLWSQRFSKFVEYHLASEVAMSVTGDEKKRDAMLAMRERMKREALSTDAMQDPSRQLPSSGWVRARMSGGNREHR